jgi:crotonobetainyl-CoA:carnitine CoA-transferase CaiB-like acyl-CoA transferase
MGPLAGVKVVEMAGIGPGPLAAMLLADLGATVIRVDRKQPADVGVPRPIEFDLALRNRKSIRVDLKEPGGVALVLDLIAQADALIEGFRPGVMERLGLGPDICLSRNPRLVYGRVTGWGQDGPLAQAAGHDINYIAVTGLLHAIGRAGQPPTLPLNVMGDYAGGSMVLAFGIVAALFEAQRSGRGQVIDAAMVDGVASLLTVLLGLVHAGKLGGERGTNFIDSGAPFYEVYECADGAHLAVGPIEPRFYGQLIERLELDAAARAELGAQWDHERWPRAKAVLAARFKTRSRAEWERCFEGADVCVSPVLEWEQAWTHPHLRARGTFIEVDGVMQPAPAPRFSRTAAERPRPPAPLTTENAVAALGDWLSEEQITAHRAAGHFI